MPFELSADLLATCQQFLRRGKSDFEWSEGWLLAQIAPPLRRTDVQWATIGLRDCGTRLSIPALKNLASFPNQDIRACAILTIAHIAGAAETEYYAACLLDPQYKTKRYALWAISEAGDERALPAVETYVKKNGSIFKAAMQRPIDRQASIEVLVYLCRHQESSTRARELLAEWAYLRDSARSMPEAARMLLIQRHPGIETLVAEPAA